jgi:hypothetical protein
MLVAAILCFISYGMSAEEARVIFPQHPRLAYTAKEISAWRADVSRTAELIQVRDTAEKILARGLVIPKKEGDWIFYYACPKDGSMLNAKSDKEHVCPRCGAIYTDERVQAAYRTLLNNRLDSDLYKIALAFALTDDTKYAIPVRDSLLELARLYPTFQRHDRWGRKGPFAVVGGRRYAQHLDEAYSAIELAKAYDLIASSDSISPEQHVTIEDFLKSIVKEIQKYEFFVDPQGINNHISWFNAAYANVGIATGDPSLLQEAISGKFGLLHQLEKSVTSDGLWYEGTLAYHFYALSAIEELLRAAARAGFDFSSNERLKSMYLGPIKMAYPDGSVPAFHDSDPLNLRNWTSFYKFALDYFHDPAFAQYANPVGNAPVREQKSAVLPGIGLAILRSGSERDAVCAMMDYGIHGGSHGHPDKLNIVVYALGKELVPDIGRISYSVPEYETWARTTAAHNTVVIDRSNQAPCEGSLLFFRDTGSYSAALCAASNAYKNALLKRMLILTDGLLVDIYTVDSENDSIIDWFLHIRGKSATLSRSDGTILSHTAILQNFAGSNNGYQHLTDVVCWETTASAVIRMVQADGKIIGIHALQSPQSQIFTGYGIGYTLEERIPFIMRRVASRRGCFITVYDLSGTGEAVSSIRILPVSGQRNVLPMDRQFTLSITHNGKEIAYRIDLRDGARSPLVQIKSAR